METAASATAEEAVVSARGPGMAAAGGGLNAKKGLLGARVVFGFGLLDLILIMGVPL
jgi:hypothetical protein